MKTYLITQAVMFLLLTFAGAAYAYFGEERLGKKLLIASGLTYPVGIGWGLLLWVTRRGELPIAGCIVGCWFATAWIANIYSALLIAQFKERSGGWTLTAVVMGAFATVWLIFLPKRSASLGSRIALGSVVTVLVWAGLLLSLGSPG